MDEPADAEVHARRARERLAVLDAVVSGQRRDAEVAAVLWEAEDRDEVARWVGGVGGPQAG